jgi:hypothetical protein
MVIVTLDVWVSSVQFLIASGTPRNNDHSLYISYAKRSQWFCLDIQRNILIDRFISRSELKQENDALIFVISLNGRRLRPDLSSSTDRKRNYYCLTIGSFEVFNGEIDFE